FMTPDEIARASARKTSNLVDRSVKVRTQCNDNGRWQANAGGRANGMGDCTAQNTRPVWTGAFSSNECLQMDLWVDGVRSTLSIDDIPVRTIVALEVYSGPATTPTSFGAGNCGVVAIWTNGTS